MRGLRSFLVLLAVLIGLGAYVYFVESKRDPLDTGPKKDKVFAVEADKIEELTIRSESGDKTTLRKTGDDWQIVDPVTARPDSAEVSGLTTNLATLEIQSVVQENAPDLGAYGLDKPRVEVAFKAGGQQHALQIGQKTPPGTDLYAKRANGNTVFLISSYLDSTFNRGTFDLRDKTVLRVERDKLEALEIEAGGREMRFVKSGAEWRLAAPVQGRADFNAVDGLVSRLTGLQMKSVADAEADPAELKKFGLDKPAATVRLGSGSSQASLTIGGEAEEGSVYAKDGARAAVYTVDASLLEELKKTADEFRQKDLFDARTFNTTRVEIARGDQTIAFEKTKSKNKDGQEEEKWRQTAPQARDVDQAKVESLLSTITGVRATEFAGPSEKSGLEKPELTVTIRFDEGKKEERVAFARSGSNAYASRADDKAVAKIDAATIDSIVKGIEELK
jgi:hypothetical protein